MPLACHSYDLWHAFLSVLWVVKRDHRYTSVGQTLQSAHRPYCSVYSSYKAEGSQWWVRLMLAGSGVSPASFGAYVSPWHHLCPAWLF